MARTTCHSLSTKPGSAPRAVATCSARRGSSTFEAQRNSVVPNVPTRATSQADGAIRRHVARYRLDANALERFPQSREPFGRNPWFFVGAGPDGARIEAKTYLHELAQRHELPQNTADLVIAPEVTKRPLGSMIAVGTSPQFLSKGA